MGSPICASHSFARYAEHTTISCSHSAVFQRTFVIASRSVPRSRALRAGPAVEAVPPHPPCWRANGAPSAGLVLSARSPSPNGVGRRRGERIAPPRAQITVGLGVCGGEIPDKVRSWGPGVCLPSPLCYECGWWRGQMTADIWDKYLQGTIDK